MKAFAAVLGACLVACGARTDIPEGVDDEADSSVPDVAEHDQATPDVTAPDVTVEDVTVEDVSIEDVSIPDVSIEDVIVIDAAPPDDGGPACVPDCKHNFECETSCPSLTSGRWCCDEEVGMCYAFAGKHCPAVIFDAGLD